MSLIEMESTSIARTPPLDAEDQVAAALKGQLLKGPGRQALHRMYVPVLSRLAEVEHRLGRELQSPYEALAPVLRHGTQLGGKRLRPAMLLLCGAAVGELTDEHVVLGTVIEMVHTATLIHDDVLDEAKTRRHVATINARWDEHTSILLGDYLFAQSFRLAATLASTEACRWIGEAARLVCEGELRQVLQREVIDIDEATYIDMIQGQDSGTVPRGMPAWCQVSPAASERLSRDDGRLTATQSGSRFQIADDYLDFGAMTTRSARLWGPTSLRAR